MNLLSLIGIFLLHYLVQIKNAKKIEKEGKEKRVLVLSYFNLGDIVCDSPSLRAIRSNWPDAYIHVLVRRDEGIEFLKYCPYIDNVDKITSQLDSVKDYIRLIKYLNNYEFTHSFQLVRHFNQVRKSYLPFVLNIPNRYGILNEKKLWLYKYCYTSYIKVGRKLSRKEESIEVVKLAGVQVFDKHTECWINPLASKTVTKKLSLYNNGRDALIIHPGATLDIKCWPPEYYAKLINNLSSSHSNRVLLTGTKKEIEILNKIKRSCRINVEIVYDLTIHEFIELTGESRI